MSRAEPLPRVPSLDGDADVRAKSRQGELLKPPGSLGRLETLATDLAAMTSDRLEDLWPPFFLVFAADHGVAAEGVSAFPSEVTAQMVRSFLLGHAAISVLAHANAAELRVVDVGVAADLDVVLEGVDTRRLVRAKVREGTRNFAVEPALRRVEVLNALQVGRAQAESAIGSGAGILGLGEMGIGNTTSAAAVTVALTGCDVDAATGRGTGLDDRALSRKADVIGRAVRAHHPDAGDPIDVLSKLGGLEIAALVGAIIEAASRRVPVVLDGFITAAAALAAVSMAPGSIDYMIASHRSCEPGHDIVLRSLGKKPLLDLELRLGEASGAALAMPLIRAAVRLHLDMATFAEAGVAGAD